MKHIYEFPLEIDTGEAVPSFGEVLKRINTTMREFGFHETMVLRSTVGHTTVTSARQLTPSELDEIGNKIQLAMDEKLTLKVYVGKPRYHPERPTAIEDK